VPFSAPVLTYRAKGLASNIQSKVLKVHNTLININITAILAPEMTYTPKFLHRKQEIIAQRGKIVCAIREN
jgi:hypothetical protein